MPRDSRRAELLGYGTPSGSKVEMNGNGKRGRESEQAVWKKEPTRIAPPGSSITNPYDRRSQGMRRREASADHTFNGVSQPPGPKKRKVEDMYSHGASKYFSKGSPSMPTTTSMFIANTITKQYGSSAVPSSSKAIPSLSAVLKGKGKESVNNGRMSFKMNGHARMNPFANGQPIEVPDDTEHEDMGVPLHRKSSADELNILDLPNSSMTIADDLGVSIPDSRHPFRQLSPPRPSSSRASAQDGPSTQRLRREIESRKAKAPLSNGITESKSRASSPPETVDLITDEVEEIEDADTFSSPESGVKVHSKPPSKRTTSPGGTTIFATNNVQKKKEMFESLESKTKPTAPEVDLKELKTMQPKKGLTSSMKSKTGRMTLRIESKRQPERSTRAARNSRKDHVATSSTLYTDGSEVLALPLEVCIWGTDIFEVDSEAVDPSHWVIWNTEASELQIVEHPPASKLRKQKAVKRIKFEYLQDHILQVSEEKDKSLFKIDFDADRKVGPADTSKLAIIGITLKFMRAHPNTVRGVVGLRSALLKLCRQPPRSLIGTAIDKCLEMARRSAEQVLSSSDRAPSPEPTTAAPANDSDGEDTSTTVPGKPRVRPRSTYGKAAMKHAEPSRRSARLSLPKEPSSPAASSLNLDDVILVYPHNGSGALNITNGDLKRLEPSEFLNDTLIELGLKFLMSDIRENNPELADEIHVFSTFFYKKLNHKSFEDGYKSVRKWTAKIDLFKKKYIIVPINENIHWYLAIIYRPEYVLDPAEPKAPPRVSRRISNLEAAPTVMSNTSAIQEKASSDSSETTKRIQRPSTIQGDDGLDSDAAVEQVIESTRSCSIDDEFAGYEHMRTDSPELGNDFGPYDETAAGLRGQVEGGGPMQPHNDNATDSDSDGRRTEEEEDQLADDDDEFQYPLPDSHSASHTPMPILNYIPNLPQSGVEDEPMDVDSTTYAERLREQVDVGGTKETIQLRSACLSSKEVDKESCSPVDTSRCATVGSEDGGAEDFPPISAASFYRTARELALQKDLKSSSLNRSPIDEIANGKEMEKSEDEKDDEDSNSMSADITTSDERATWIFTFDSLGTRHDKACKLLGRYLMAEAQDKKGIENSSETKGKQAQVPVQPNYCDCGLYLLHFARMFLSNPDRFKNLICNSTKKQQASTRNAIWQGDQVANMRKEMSERIRKESEVYKKLKAERENQKKEAEAVSGQATAAESSDDEIIVGPITKRNPSLVKKDRKSNTSTKSATPTTETKATRLRG